MKTAENFVKICAQEDYEAKLYAAKFPKEVNLALFDANGGVIWTTSAFYEDDLLSEFQKTRI